jgi:hypothetical protein
VLRRVQDGEEEDDENERKELGGDEEVAMARAIAGDTQDRFIHPPDRFEFHEYRKWSGSLARLQTPRWPTSSGACQRQRRFPLLQRHAAPPGHLGSVVSLVRDCHEGICDRLGE